MPVSYCVEPRLGADADERRRARSRALLRRLDRARADDDPVDELGGCARVLAGRDAEARVEREVGDARGHAPASGASVGASSVRAPVVPVTVTRYSQPSVAAAASRSRSSVDVGATSWTRRSSGRTSAGRSATISEVAPAARASRSNRSQPYASKIDEYVIGISGTSTRARVSASTSRQRACACRRRARARRRAGSPARRRAGPRTGSRAR